MADIRHMRHAPVAAAVATRGKCEKNAPYPTTAPGLRMIMRTCPALFIT